VDFVAELSATMFSVEKAKDLNWGNLWIETDSKLLVSAFN